MKSSQQQLDVATPGRGLHDITAQVRAAVGSCELNTGLCHLFIRHTSASLVITENCDPAVLRDLERCFARFAPDGDPDWEHDAEGPDDMPAHIRSVLTQTALSVPIVSGDLALGTWQGIFVWEHRLRPHRRQIVITLIGA